MSFRKVVSGDPLEPMRALVRQMEEARTQMSEEEQAQSALDHAQVLARIAQMEEREQRYQAERAQGRKMAEAYNIATPEEQARPFGEWLEEWRRGQRDAGPL